MPKEFLKDPDATLDYEVDWEDWLGSDGIASSAWTVSGADEDLAIDSDSINGDKARVWLSGGTLGLRYTVTNRITTSEGRVDDRSISVTIFNK